MILCFNVLFEWKINKEQRLNNKDINKKWRSYRIFFFGLSVEDFENCKKKELITKEKSYLK